MASVAVFVKTPHLSPVKTRLAEEIGVEGALQFYNASILALTTVLKKASLELDLTVKWAVAEPECSQYWREFSVMGQGDGGLGDRLGKVYAQLLRESPPVVFLGADCPIVTVWHLREALSQLRWSAFVLGKSSDGGFYLFGGKEPLSPDSWLRVPYSDSSTCERLRQELSQTGSVSEVPELFDVDTRADLARLATYASPALLPEQEAVIRLASRLVS